VVAALAELLGRAATILALHAMQHIAAVVERSCMRLISS
jgi:hypothetical protein